MDRGEVRAMDDETERGTGGCWEGAVKGPGEWSEQLVGKKMTSVRKER